MRIFVAKQSDSKDCAAACLESIIKYYHGFIPNSIISENLYTSKNGTSLYNIIKYSKKIGFDAKGLKCSFTDLVNKNIKLPVIAHVTINNYFHYLVIYQINHKHKTILVMDPASGKRKMTFDQLESIYNQVIVTFYKVKELPVYQKNDFFKILKSFVTPHVKTLLLIFILSIIFTLLNVAMSFYFKYLIDILNNPNELSLISGLIIGLSLTICFLLYMRGKLIIRINKYLAHDLFSVVIKQIILLPYKYYKNKATGDILVRVNDIEVIKNLFSHFFVILFLDLTLMIISLIMLFSINYSLALISIIIVILYSGAVLYFNKNCSQKTLAVKEEYSLYNQSLLENIRGFETVKGLNIQDNIIAKSTKNYDDYQAKAYSLASTYNQENVFKNIISYLGNYTILIIGGFLVLGGNISLGTLITFNILFTYFFEPIKSIGEFEEAIRDGYYSLKRISDLFYLQSEDKKQSSFEDYQITIKDLSFSYQEESKLIDHFSLSVSEGERVLLTGKSGIGKSTILKLLMKYYDVADGMIFIGKKDIKQYFNEDIRREIAYVSQDEILFTDTLFNNINLANADLKEVDEIKRIVCLDLDNNILIAEDGFNLSGGEKQRLVLGRALLFNRKVVLLDESLSEVNTSLERKILKNIFAKYQGTTFIMISHHLANQDLFNKIVTI